MERYRIEKGSLPAKYGELDYLIKDICNFVRDKQDVHYTVTELDLDKEGLSQKDANDFDEFLDSTPCPYVTFIIYCKNPEGVSIEDIRYIGVSEKGNLPPKATSQQNEATFSDIEKAKYIQIPTNILLSFLEDIEAGKLSVLYLLLDGNCNITVLSRLKEFMNNPSNLQDTFREKTALLLFTSGIRPESYEIVPYTINNMPCVGIKMKNECDK